MPRQRIDLTGHRYGRLTVIDEKGRDKYGHVLWNCLCDCGNTTVATTSNIRCRTTSCGCVNKEKITSHGMHDTRQYQIWADMKSRCTNPSNPYFNHYGGAGVSVDPQWETFEGFWKDMQDGYCDTLTIDRIDPYGNYTKDNCRWSNKSVQNHNKRKQKDTHSKYIGVTLDKRYNTWYAHIKGKYLGTFLSELPAAIAYDNASEEIFGDRPNKTQRPVKKE